MSNETAGARLALYSADELHGVLDRMAHQAACLLRPHAHIAVIGIRRRGAPLADALVDRLVHAHGLPMPQRADLSVKRYADDLSLLHPLTHLTDEPALAQMDLRGRIVLLVDDVFYTGLSMLRVTEHLSHREPAEIRLAVLADRGCARVPLRPDITGVHLDVAPRDIVECLVPPYEPQWGISVCKPLLGGIRF